MSVSLKCNVHSKYTVWYSVTLSKNPLHIFVVAQARDTIIHVHLQVTTSGFSGFTSKNLTMWAS